MSEPLQFIASNLTALQQVSDRFLLGTRCQPTRPAAMSYSVQVLQLGDCVAADLSMNVGCTAQGLGPAKAQPGWLVTFQVSGTSKVEQGRRSLVLEPGTWMLSELADLGSLHASDRARLLGLLVPRHERPMWSAIASTVRLRQMRVTGAVGAAVAQLLALLRADVVLDGTSQQVIRDALLALLEQSLLQEAGSIRSGGRQAASVKDVQRWIRTRAHETDLSTKTVARAFGVSRRTLYNLFANEEATPRAYILECRLRLAAERLRDPDCRHLKVSTIGQQCGFALPTQFSRCFASAFGVPPAQWRDGMAQGVSHDEDIPQSCTVSQDACTI